MDSSTTSCPQCHAAMRPEYYFCYNCGKNLHPAPLSTSVATQAWIYIGSIILAPMGLIWGMRYLRQAGLKAKVVGVVSLLLTIATLLIVSKLLTDYLAQVNDQVTNQLNSMQGF